MNMRRGQVVGVNGNMVAVTFQDRVMQNEVAYIAVGEERLMAEVIRVKGARAELQVFEDTQGVRIGDSVDFSGNLLSVQLGPGLMSQVYDGLQNPLPELAGRYGFFLKRGVYLSALPDEAVWEFTPAVKAGDKVRAGDKMGIVPEKMFEHWIMLPFGVQGVAEVVSVVPKGQYRMKDPVAQVRDEQGRTVEVTLRQVWPVKVPIRCYARKVKPTTPLVTKQRLIDTFFPIAEGGTFCTPGPFGAGKTVLQHLMMRHAEVDVVIVAACGERAGEVVEVLREFPELKDPRTGKSLMDRTIVICNTSSMPVAAREASVYTAVTIGEYYRQMGLRVFVLADSTSRWAQAMREMSARLEEIPGEEAFPAYLESRIASFYERAGLVQLRDGSMGSVTIGGAVSPAGGNFEEPVTQATLKVVGSFLGLSKARADARRYPAIDPLDSWSKYQSFIDEKKVAFARSVLQSSSQVQQMMKVVGEEGTAMNDFVLYLKGEFLDAVYLQQNAFDPTDEFTPADRQKYVFEGVMKVLETDFGFPDKDSARAAFLSLRQKFITWNSCPFEGEEFRKTEQEWQGMIQRGQKTP